MDQTCFTSVILLAGGSGSRMGKGPPKQFRPLSGKPLVLHSFELFLTLAEIYEIVVVCDPSHRSLFPPSQFLRFALPGKRRQDSVYNGLLATSSYSDMICIHDAARPFVEKEAILAVLTEARTTGAAALAIPATNTIKQASSDMRIQRTLPRHELWELQTPQVIKRALLLQAYAHPFDATDDLSLIEALGLPATLVKSSPKNFKITTPLDWAVAEVLCASN